MEGTTFSSYVDIKGRHCWIPNIPSYHNVFKIPTDYLLKLRKCVQHTTIDRNIKKEDSSSRDTKIPLDPGGGKGDRQAGNHLHVISKYWTGN